MPALSSGPFRGALPLLVLLGVIFLFINRHQWATEVSHSADDASYLSHAMTMGLDFDLDYANEVAHPYATVEVNGRPVPRNFFGAGLMAAPFVAAFSVVDRIEGHPVIVDHRQYLHSWSYFGFSVAVHVYFLAAVTLLWAAARQAGASLGPLAVTALVLSSGVAYYVITRCRMSHGFEFFAMALCVRAGVGMGAALADGRRWWGWLAAGAVGSTLAVAVRLNDLNVLALPALALLLPALARGTPSPRAAAVAALASMAACLAALVFLLPMHFALYGAPVPDIKALHGTHGGGVPMPTNAEGAQAFLVLLAQLLPQARLVAFGGEFGLLWTDPLAVIGPLLGLAVVLRARAAMSLRLATAGLLGLYVLTGLAVTLMWRNTGHSWGWRYLLPLFPLGFVSLCAWWPTAGAVARRTVAAALAGLGTVAVVGFLLFTKTPGLSYHWGISPLGVETETAPDFVPNLARETFSAKAWDVALKDGMVGWVNKMRGKNLEARQPPVVGLWLGMLFALWMGWGVAMARAAYRRR